MALGNPTSFTYPLNFNGITKYLEDLVGLHLCPSTPQFGYNLPRGNRFWRPASRPIHQSHINVDVTIVLDVGFRNRGVYFSLRRHHLLPAVSS
jgi:hypothetical protein